MNVFFTDRFLPPARLTPDSSDFWAIQVVFMVFRVASKRLSRDNKHTSYAAAEQTKQVHGYLKPKIICKNRKGLLYTPLARYFK
uniref:Uncharacterized protein n=1 Tax=Anopheles atroparvus TaxID=41427 RepID=A0AAG5DQB3_ANOAO